MTKNTPFKAYDLQRKKLHTITGSRPAKISSHRLNRHDWAVSKESTRKGRKAKSRAALKRTSKSILDVLSYDRSDWHCRYCGRAGDDPDCDSRCYKKFKQEKFLLEDAIDIRGPGRLGYGAFAAPNTHIKKGQYLGEYIGILKPLDRIGEGDASLYCVNIPNVCVIDAESAGNWTRFVNSSCEPNVNARWDVIGKRHVVLLQARENIGPEEELTFNYGPRYFEHAGLECECSAKRRKHAPASPSSRRSSPRRK